MPGSSSRVGGRRVEVDARPSDALALAVRTGARIFAAESVLDQAGLGADSGMDDDEREGGALLESTGEQMVDPRLDVFRDFVNSLDVDPDAGGSRGSWPPGWRPSDAGPPLDGSPLSSGRPRRSDRDRFTHMYRRSRQKSRTARRMTCGLAPVGRAGGPRVVRHPDLGDPRPRGLELDEQLGREERAVALDGQAAQGVAAEELAGAVDVGDLEPEEDPVGQAITAGVEGPDQRDRRA